MIRKTVVGLLVFVGFIVAGCAGGKVLYQPFPADKVLHISHFREMKTPGQFNSCVFYFDAGDTLPLKLTLDNDLIGIQQPAVDLVFKQKVYFRLRVSESMSALELAKLSDLTPERLDAMDQAEKKALLENVMLFTGRDGVHWAALNDMKALKDVLGIKGGSVTYGLGIGAEDGAWTALDVKTTGQKQ